jgi:NurA-like 5'-3' nuclease
MLRKIRKKSKYGQDKRRKHRHWQVTVYYHDGEKFARVYTNRARAASFAERQKKSPVVKATRVLQIN